MNSAGELVPETAVNGRASAMKRAAAELAATEGASLNQIHRGCSGRKDRLPARLR